VVIYLSSKNGASRRSDPFAFRLLPQMLPLIDFLQMSRAILFKLLIVLVGGDGLEPPTLSV
jgi:hypothetical protein